ncbi:hypothetical protein AB4027_10790 [Alkalibacterium putridalgicola]|uniref:hypothetical protein n=1 Tax=Alkalibacterium putridalgicola TaxID=426703 RepID=UPI0034CD421B
MAFPEHLRYLELLIEEGIEKEGDEFLIGALNLSDVQYFDVLDFARALIKKEKLLYKVEANMIISVALVFFAINDYRGKQFWEEFSKRIDADELYVQKICKEAIESFCESRQLYFHIGHMNKGYVTTILTHAIITESSVDKFLEFLEDIYFKDLEETYDEEEVQQLVEYMHKLFSRYIEDEDIHIDFQGSKMTIARQQLPKSFRIAFVRAAGLVAPVIEKYLYYINELNYSQKIVYNFMPRFDYYFMKYEKLRPKITFNTDQKREEKKEYIKRFSVAHMSLNDGKLCLEVPKQIIDSDYVSDSIYLEVYSNESLLARKELSLIKNRLFFKTDSEKIELSSFHADLRYEITTRSRKIYDSRDLLTREFLIFNIEGVEVSPSRIQDKDYRIVTRTNTKLEVENGETTSRLNSEYKIHTVYLKSDSLLKIDQWMIKPNAQDFKTEVSIQNKYPNIRMKLEDEYSLYSQIPTIRLVIPPEKKLSDYAFSVNENNYSLESCCKASYSNILNGSNALMAVVTISTELLREATPYSIMIREKGNYKPIISEKLVVIPGIEYAFDQTYYYKKEEALLKEFKTGNHLEIKEKLPIKIKLKHNAIASLTLVNNIGEKMKITIDLPYLEWDLSGYHSSHHVTDIWYNKVSDQNLKVSYYKPITQLRLLDSKSHYKVNGRVDNQTTLFDLHDYTYVKRDEPLTLGVIVEGKKEKIATIHYHPKIKNFAASYYPPKNGISGLFVEGYFIGEGDLKVVLKNKQTSKVLRKYELRDELSVVDHELELDYGLYTIEVYLIEEDDFFGQGSTEQLLAKKELLVGDPLLVVTKNKVAKVNKCKTYHGNYTLDNFHLQNFRFSKREGYYEADGFYYIKDWDTKELRKWYFSRYNPFLIKVAEATSSMFELEIEDKEGDGLYYDIKSKHVNPKHHEKEEYIRVIDTITVEISEVL